MKYRAFGKKNWKTSVLGFGCMRFPVVDGDAAKIDEHLAEKMLIEGIDQGINYIDTAYPYHSGQSEPFVGKVLSKGYRQKVHLATKMPTWLTKEQADFDKYLDEQLARLQTDHLDLYLLHALNRQRWEGLKGIGVREWMHEIVKSGKVGAIGFSFHDDYPAFEDILMEYEDWDFCQIQYNYMDIEEQAGMRGLHLAAARGLAVVVMEPLLGGKLSTPPVTVQSLLKAGNPDRSATDWALQWLWSQPEVNVVLSGMSAIQHVEENIRSANKAAVASFLVAEQEVIRQARETYRTLSPIPCTKCNYCLPCPNGVLIPNNFDLFNKANMLDNWDHARWAYRQLADAEKAENCITCRECEQLCPQHIPISDWMPYIHEVLANDAVYDGRRLP